MQVLHHDFFKNRKENALLLKRYFMIMILNSKLQTPNKTPFFPKNYTMETRIYLMSSYFNHLNLCSPNESQWFMLLACPPIFIIY